MNRWAADFRKAQETNVINERTLKALGLFELQGEERAALMELNNMMSAEASELA